MKYNIHVYPIVRILVPGVEADSQAEAIKEVDRRMDSGEINLHQMLDRPGIEFAEDIDGYYVDEVGDTEFKNSTWYDKDGKHLD